MFFYEYRHSPISLYRGSQLTFPQHLHQHMELIYVLGGELKVTNDEVTRYLHKGDMSVSFPNTLHSYESIGASDHLMCIFDDSLVSYFKDKLTKYHSTTPFIMESPATVEIWRYLGKIKDLLDHQGSMDLVAGYVNLVTALVLEQLDLVQREGGAKYSEWFVDVLTYISHHYTEKITLSDLAERISISPYYLSRKFTEHMKCNLNEYVNQIRVSNAVTAIKNTDKTITEICYECGFENIRSFNRAFKKVTGRTPTQFRYQDEGKSLSLFAGE